MPSIRSHNKSRTGCTQCKRRRIKCDERPPCCTNCSKKGIECEYRYLQGALDALQILTPDHMAARTSRKSRSPETSLQQEPAKAPLVTSISLDEQVKERTSCSQSPPGSSASDVDLFYTFITETCSTIGPKDHDHTAWRDEVPSLALSHPFLLHAILGLSAAHQLSQGSPHITEHVARGHYDAALRLFRETFTGVDSSEAIIVFRSYTVVIATLFIFWECQQPSDRDPVDGFAYILSHLQSSRAIVAQATCGDVKGGNSAPLDTLLPDQNKHHRAHAIESLPLQESMQDMRSRLREHAALTTTPPADAASLSHALSLLCIYHSIVPITPTDGAGFVTWLLGLDAHFTKLLKRREPLALCMVAHWSVPLCNAPWKWYAGAWPRKLLHGIELDLAGSEWDQCLKWPLQATNDSWWMSCDMGVSV